MRSEVLTGTEKEQLYTQRKSAPQRIVHFWSSFYRFSSKGTTPGRDFREKMAGNVKCLAIMMHRK